MKINRTTYCVIQHTAPPVAVRICEKTHRAPDGCAHMWVNTPPPRWLCAYVSQHTAPRWLCAYVSQHTALPVGVRICESTHRSPGGCAHMWVNTPPPRWLCANVSQHTAPPRWLCTYVSQHTTPRWLCAYVSQNTAPPVAVRIWESQCITSFSGCLWVQFRMSTTPVLWLPHFDIAVLAYIWLYDYCVCQLSSD